jgi:hypothetical protein
LTMINRTHRSRLASLGGVPPPSFSTAHASLNKMVKIPQHERVHALHTQNWQILLQLLWKQECRLGGRKFQEVVSEFHIEKEPLTAICWCLGGNASSNAIAFFARVEVHVRHAGLEDSELQGASCFLGGEIDGVECQSWEFDILVVKCPFWLDGVGVDGSGRGDGQT